MNDPQKVKNVVKQGYSQIAGRTGQCCCGSNMKAQRQSGQLGYSEDEMTSVPSGANLGLGCGNPTAIASLKEGEVVLDLGSGAGFDVFWRQKKLVTLVRQLVLI